MTEKKEKRKYDGAALEADVMRKMAHQLERLPTGAARVRMSDFIARAAAEGKSEVVVQTKANGQHGLGLDLE